MSSHRAHRAVGNRPPVYVSIMFHKLLQIKERYRSTHYSPSILVNLD